MKNLRQIRFLQIFLFICLFTLSFSCKTQKNVETTQEVNTSDRLALISMSPEYDQYRKDFDASLEASLNTDLQEFYKKLREYDSKNPTLKNLPDSYFSDVRGGVVYSKSVKTMMSSKKKLDEKFFFSILTRKDLEKVSMLYREYNPSGLPEKVTDKYINEGGMR